MSDKTMTEIEPTQGDRDAAADYMAERGYDWGFCGDVREGRVEHPLPIHFARHRLAALEEAAKAVEAMEQPIDWDLSHPGSIANNTKRHIATAIRNLKEPPR